MGGFVWVGLYGWVCVGGFVWVGLYGWVCMGGFVWVEGCMGGGLFFD